MAVAQCGGTGLVIKPAAVVSDYKPQITARERDADLDSRRARVSGCVGQQLSRYEKDERVVDTRRFPLGLHPNCEA